MNKKLLYIGNKLSIHGLNATSIETLGAFLEQEGYNVYYASSKKNKLTRILDMIYSTLKYSRKVDYVLIDVYSTQNFYYALIISQLCRFLNIKYIAKLHGGDLPNRLKNSPRLCDLIFNNACSISAPSNYLLQSFKNKYTKNLHYIPNTIEINKYQFTNKDFSEPRLLWVRSFSTIYNPIMAINVALELKKTYPNVALCMVGPNKENLLEKCKNYAHLHSIDVKFTGKLSKDEWIKLSQDYNIFINTTHFDNTPVSVIEAMALGLPVVSTNVGGIPYLISNNENGLLVNDDDAIAMANAIKKLLNNPEQRNSIIVNARKYVEQFDWEIVKKEWYQILK
jgi:glycosyltransferase involved in cell wall biosynthesis